MEIYLIRSICNDDTKALDAYNLLDSLTRDHGLFVYDYRMLNDFVTNIETIKTAVEEFENQPSENTDNTAVEIENQPSENTGNTENVFRFPGGKNKRKTLKKRKKTKNTSSKKGRRTQRRQIKKKRQTKKEKKSKN